MIIKSSKKKKIRLFKKKKFVLFLKVYFFSTLAIGLFFIFLFTNTGIFENFIKKYKNQIYANGIINYIHFPEIFVYKLNNYFINHKKINININKKNQILLESNRNDILKYLENSSMNDYKHKYPFITTKAKISYEGNIYDAQISLKGDRQVHFNDKKKSSYKINLKNNETINFSNTFSLQKPNIRNYIHEWLFHEFLKIGKLVTINYDFVDLYINGDYQGFYAFEEGFGKILIEKNLRRNGPIFHINEGFGLINDNEINFEVYDKKFWEEENIELLNIANNKLTSFKDGKLDLDDVFDLEKWAWFFAAIDLTYAYHGAAINSVKYYYNPTTSKIEPIGYDGHRLVPNYNNKFVSNFYPELDKTNFIFAIENKDMFFAPLIQKSFFFKYNGELNYEFYDIYLDAIKKITSKPFLDNFFEKRKKIIKEITSGIYSDNYQFETSGQRKSGIGIYYFSKKEYYRRAEQIKDLYSPKITKILVLEKDDHYSFENNYIHNYNFSNISFFCKDKIFNFNELKIKDKLLINKNQLNNFVCNKVQITDTIFKKNYILNINRSNYIKKFSILDKQKYLEYFYIDGLYLKLINNDTIIENDIIIPKNFTVKILGGQKIYLKNNSFIISNSNIDIDGLNSSILISGYENNHGGGLIIYGNKKKNKIHNVTFRYLNGGSLNNNINDKIIYGSLNFINTSVDLNNLKFESIFSEDAINIISSTFSIKNSNFIDIYSDGIDVDFGSGNINNLYLQNIKNDGIDLSGSNVKIDNIILNNIGDKAISVGEKSNIEISNILINKSLVSIASKDNSSVIAKNIKSNSVKYPYASYKKKNEYGPAKLIVSNLDSKDHKYEFVLDKESEIFNLDKKIKIKYDKKYDEVIKQIIK